MRPDAEWIRARVAEWNVRCFGGALPVLPVRLSNARSFMGKVSYVTRSLPGGRRRHTDLVLHISTCFDLDEETLVDTILHEMIHCEILLSGKRDNAPHGHLFRARMADINRLHGRHITVTHRLTSDESASDIRHRHHLVCISRFSSGGYGVTRVARTRLFELWDAMLTLPGVERVQWIWTTDPWFGRYPRSTRPVAYKADASRLRAHLDGARVLTRCGDTIRPLPLTDTLGGETTYFVS